jgi:chemotaxis protein MotB
MRSHLFRFLVAGLVLASLVGCAPSGPSGADRNLHVELRQAEKERDALASRLNTAEARNTTLQERLQTADVALNVANAENKTLEAQLTTLRKNLADLRTLLESAKEQRPERPAVRVSPLPPATDAALAALSTKYGDRLWYDRERAAISLANDRLFASGSDKVRTEAQAALHDLAAILAATPADEWEIILVGHTDDTPITKPETLAKHPSNWHLSVHRAIAVKDVLIEAGLPAGRMGVMGYSHYRPLGADRAKNRRVEVFITRKGVAQPRAPIQGRSGR